MSSHEYQDAMLAPPATDDDIEPKRGEVATWIKEVWYDGVIYEQDGADGFDDTTPSPPE